MSRQRSRNPERPIAAPAPPLHRPPRDKTKRAVSRPKGCCLACKVRKDRSTLRTGPDGGQTLCNGCNWRYRALRLHVFQLPDGTVTAAWKPGARPVKMLGFHKHDGLQDLSRPRVSSFCPDNAPSHGQGLCLRCKHPSRPACRSGPDGTRTLCVECFGLYRACEFVLYKQEDGLVSVVETPGSRPVRMHGFRKTSPREHYLHPLVHPPAGDQNTAGVYKNEPEQASHHSSCHTAQISSHSLSFRAGGREQSRGTVEDVQSLQVVDTSAPTSSLARAQTDLHAMRKDPALCQDPLQKPHDCLMSPLENNRGAKAAESLQAPSGSTRGESTGSTSSHNSIPMFPHQKSLSS